MYVVTGEPNMKWGAPISNGGRPPLDPSLATALDESVTVATNTPYTRLRKKQIENCILNKSYQFSLIQCFLKFLLVQSSFHRECD